MRNTKGLIALILLLSTFVGKAQKGTVLFFIAQDSTYYSEYIVAYEALTAAGYNVDVRSATSNPVNSYMIPTGTTINFRTNTL